MAKTGVKLAYKNVFATVFTSDGHPMLLARLKPGKKMSRPKQLQNLLVNFSKKCLTFARTSAIIAFAVEEQQCVSSSAG